MYTKKKIQTTTRLVLALALLLPAGLIQAATPPELVNFEGVLRDASGVPETGTKEMEFVFYDTDGGATCPAGGGTVLLADSHLFGGSGGVTITDGLFNVELGGGVITAVSESSLSEVFRDNSDVYLEVVVDSEVLCPRIHMISAAYSLNADNLDGEDSAFYLNTSSTAQTKTGLLTASGGVDFGGGADDDLTAADVTTLTDGVSSADALHGHASAGNADTLDGLDSTFFVNTGAAAQTKTGDLTVQDLTVSGNDIFLGNGAQLQSTIFGLTLLAGADIDDDLILQAGNDFADGGIAIVGDLQMEFRAGNGNFHFYRGDTAEQIAGLNALGTLQLDGDADIDGGNIFLGTGGSMNNDGSIFTLTAGDADTDDLYLQAGNHFTDGGIRFFGNASTQFWAGNGFFEFVDGNTLVSKATINSLGTLQLDGDADIDGGNIFLGTGGSMNNDGSIFTLQAGDADTDDLYLQAGNNITDGGIRAFGDSSLELWSGVGVTLFIRGTDSLITASFNSTGDLTIGSASSTDDDTIFFDDVERLTWDDSQTQFEFSNTVTIEGALVVGNGANAEDPGFSCFTNNFGCNPDSALITDPGDVFIQNDLEVRVNAALSRTLFMEGKISGNDTNQTIFFFNDGQREQVQIRWDDIRADPTCGGTQSTEEAMIFGVNNQNTTASHGWYFMDDWNGVAFAPDIEVKIDAAGNIVADGSITASTNCDLAETFLGPDIAPGTVVVIDPERAEAVIASSRSYAPAVGVVSTRPGMLLNGATADAYPKWAEMDRVFEELALLPLDTMEVSFTDEQGNTVVEAVANPEAATVVDQRIALGRRAHELEAELDSWTRGSVPVALVGRVPVKVDGSYGSISSGDYLTTSDTPGHAMALDRAGPYFGIAMEDFTGGQGQIIVFLTQGWYGGLFDAGTSGTDGTAGASAPAEQIAEVQKMESNLQIILDRDANDHARFSVFRDGQNGLEQELLRLDEEGNLLLKGSVRPSSMDLAEYFTVSEPVSVGDVLVASRENLGTLKLGRKAGDPAVVGIVSAEPGVLLGSGITRIATADPALAADLAQARELGDTKTEQALWSQLEAKFEQTHAPVALAGTLLAKVDAGYGAIQVGDLLTTSPTVGHAMRADDPRPGTILGKALEPLDAGTGLIKVLVMLR